MLARTRLRIAITALAIGGLALAGVGCGTLGASGGAADRIEQRGTLRVGMAGDYPPMNARAIDGTLIGLEADLAAALAGILEVELELVEMPFGELLGAVRAREVDVAISGITMTPKRNLEVAFAGPYYLSRKAMLALPETLEGVDQVAQLRGRGLRITAVDGSTSKALVERVLADESHEFVATQGEAIARVRNGEADVMIADDPVIRFALLRQPGTGLTFTESRFSAEPIGIAIAPDDHLFVNLVENYLASLEYIGFLDSLREKWLDNDDWLGLLE